MHLEHSLHDGSLRPQWAGPVRISSRDHGAGREDGRIVQLSGLVVPVSTGARRGTPHASFGAGLGFPNLRDHLGDATPDLWHHWHRLEHLVSEAAASTMGWHAPRSTREAARAAMPEQALQLRIRHPPSAGGNGQGSPAAVVGEVRRVFAIRSVSGRQVRFESAGASAPFRITPSSAGWSRDPRSL